MQMTVKLKSTKPLTATHTLLLCIDDKPVAVLHNAFIAYNVSDYNTLEMKCETLTHHTPLFGAMHSASIILHTVMQAWEEEHMCIEDVFSNGDLVVDPNLYAQSTPTEQCNDSDTKQVVCKQCDTTYDGELPRWAEGDEECPECDHVQYEYKQ